MGSPDMDRRTLLRRGAVTGGALLWTAPVVQALATPASAQALGSPAPEARGLSYVALLVRRVGQSEPTYKAKYEIDEGRWVDPGPPPRPGQPVRGIPSCEDLLPEWGSAMPLTPDSSDFPTFGLELLRSGGEVTQARITIPDGWVFVRGAGKSGQSCSSATVEQDAHMRTVAVFNAPADVQQSSVEDEQAKIEQRDEREGLHRSGQERTDVEDVSSKVTGEPTESPVGGGQTAVPEPTPSPQGTATEAPVEPAASATQPPGGEFVIEPPPRS